MFGKIKLRRAGLASRLYFCALVGFHGGCMFLVAGFPFHGIYPRKKLSKLIRK